MDIDPNINTPILGELENVSKELPGDRSFGNALKAIKKRLAEPFPTGVQPNRVEKAANIARTFGRQWQLPIAVHLLALQFSEIRIPLTLGVICANLAPTGV